MHKVRTWWLVSIAPQEITGGSQQHRLKMANVTEEYRATEMPSLEVYTNLYKEAGRD